MTARTLSAACSRAKVRYARAVTSGQLDPARALSLQKHLYLKRWPLQKRRQPVQAHSFLAARARAVRTPNTCDVVLALLARAALSGPRAHEALHVLIVYTIGSAAFASRSPLPTNGVPRSTRSTTRWPGDEAIAQRASPLLGFLRIAQALSRHLDAQNH